jgi:hypothetical protein
MVAAATPCFSASANEDERERPDQFAFSAYASIGALRKREHARPCCLRAPSAGERDDGKHPPVSPACSTSFRVQRRSRVTVIAPNFLAGIDLIQGPLGYSRRSERASLASWALYGGMADAPRLAGYRGACRHCRHSY